MTNAVHKRLAALALKTVLPRTNELSTADALGLEPGLVYIETPYEVGEDQWARAERQAPQGRTRSHRKEVTDAALEEYRAEAAAGLPDVFIAKRAGTSSEVVARWRRRNGFARPRGRKPALSQYGAAAMDLLGMNLPPIQMRTRSAVGGEWSVPEFVVREPLDFDRFAAMSRQLVDAGREPGEVAAAFGVRERDVRDAVALASVEPETK